MTNEMLKTLRDAISKSALKPKQKLLLRFALVNPRLREAIGDYLASRIAENPEKSLLEPFLEYLPEIIALIELILALLDD